MKKALLAALVAVTLTFSTGCQGNTADQTRMPAVVLPALGPGRSVMLDQLRGPMVINWFASWCVACRKELPILADFAKTYSRQIKVLGIDFQDVEPDAALDLAGRSGVTYPLVADVDGTTNDNAGIPHFSGLPFLVLLDASGEVAYANYSYIHSEADLIDLVRDHLSLDLSEPS